jgi:hypothetical protein
MLKEEIVSPHHTQPTYLFFKFCMNFSKVISSKRTKSNTPTSCSRIVMTATVCSFQYVAVKFLCKTFFNVKLFGKDAFKLGSSTSQVTLGLSGALVFHQTP